MKAYIKNGKETIDDTDIKGSLFNKLNKMAININNIDINGIFLSEKELLISNSLIYKIKLILIKDNKYGK